MRIRSVSIKNFRCLQQVEVALDDLTAFIGPNSAGKSTILRALDWFFNGDPRITEQDLYSGASDDRNIVVGVTFGDLTDADRAALGPSYAPAGSTSFTAWRIWADGQEKMTARARTFPAFATIREASSAKDKKTLWDALVSGDATLELPRWTSTAAAEQAMTLWESEHPDRLEDTETGVTHLFGFNGQNKLSGLFDFVLVTADLRASEESVEGKKTIIGRILELAVDRAQADAAFAALAAEVSTRQAEINEKYLGEQLGALATDLTREVSAFATGRQVVLHPRAAEVRPTPVAVDLAITDALSETTIDRQGHGFQRALLISSLRLLASRGSLGEGSSVICLAIEEPELFQHPTQARVFAQVLRDLSQDPDGALQVAYATHSPYFIDPQYFDQIRRVTRHQADPSTHATVSVHAASVQRVSERLAGFQDDAAIRNRWRQICTNRLAEAFFADAVVLVEGETDKGVLDGISHRADQRLLEADGITVCEAGGKGGVFTPHAILAELGIPTLVIFDNDSGCPERMRQRVSAGGKGNPDAERAKIIEENRKVLRYLGEEEQDFPVGALGASAFVWDDTLEDVLATAWPEWEETRQALVETGQGVDGRNGKHGATFALAAESCEHGPKGSLLDALAAIRSLVTP